MATAGRILIIPRGKYNEESTYNMLDMVSFGGKGWICKKTCIGIEPIEGEYWAVSVDATESIKELEEKVNPLGIAYVEGNIDEVLDSIEQEHPYLYGHSDVLAELGLGDMVTVMVMSANSDAKTICQSAIGGSGTATRCYTEGDGWTEWFVQIDCEGIAETTETTMPNSCEGRLLFKEIVGKTEQNGIPTPANPQEIKSVSISGIKTHRNNLFDYSKAVNGYITNDGEFSYHPYVIISDYIPSNGNVTVSLSKNVTAIAINCFDVDKGFISKNAYENCSIATLEAVGNCAFVRVAITAGDFDLDIAKLLTYEPMVNEGDTALPYETYNVVTFSQPIELNKIGDVQDVIVDGKPINRLKKVVLNGSESGWVDSSNNTFYLQINDMAKKSVYTNSMLCDTYNIAMNHANLENPSITGYIDADNLYPNSNWIYVRDSDASNLASFKAKLQANPITLVYELVTPITSLPIADQVALNSIKTFDGTTYLEIDSPLQPEFVAEYGTSNVGGVALEAKANGENIEEMNGVLGAMNTILQDAFVPRGTATFDGDINLCVESGVYRIGSGISNAPYGNGFLIVFAWLPNVLIQVNMAYGPQYIAVRTCWYGAWQEWVRIATEKDISALQTAMINNI